MKKPVVIIATLGSLLLSAAAFADHPGTLCYATNARQSATWLWRSCSFDPNAAASYAQNNSLNLCRNSPQTFNPATCHITSCVTINCPDAYGPVANAAPSVSGPTFTCVAFGQYGHTWNGNGPDVSSALQSALANCQSNGGVNCRANASSCSAQ